MSLEIRSLTLENRRIISIQISPDGRNTVIEHRNNGSHLVRWLACLRRPSACVAGGAVCHHNSNEERFLRANGAHHTSMVTCRDWSSSHFELAKVFPHAGPGFSC